MKMMVHVWHSVGTERREADISVAWADLRVSVRAGTRAESPVSSPGTLSWPLACVGGINACITR